MIKKAFGKTGWKVSTVCQGLWNIGNQWGEMDDATAEKIIMTAYENDINLFDVADAYGIPHGLCEIRLGKALKKMKRDSIYIVSKIGNWGKRTKTDIPKTGADVIRLCGHAIVGRLQTEYVDVLLCHEGKTPVPEIYVEGLEELKKEGFTRHYGISTDNFEVLKKFYDLSNGGCTVLEVDYSLLNRDPEKDILPFCKEKNIAVLIRGALGMGLLSGKYNAQSVFKDTVRSNWNVGGKGRAEYESMIGEVEALRSHMGQNMAQTAIQFVNSHPASPFALIGATTPQQVVENSKAGDKILSPAEMEKILGSLCQG